jgi:predicted enzyme related to lactoylglutathione lyase
VKVESYQAGMPSWTDLVTTDEDAALAFYSALFGWEDEPNDAGDGMVYHMQKLGDDYVGAVAAQQPYETEQGIPPHWNTYITVDDVDAAVAKVTAAGGQVFAEPFDVMEAGRMAPIADPTGAAVILWQPKEHPGAGVRNEQGAIAWNELATRDVERAGAFFKEVFGVDVVSMPGTEGSMYTMLQIGDQPVAGLLAITEEMGQMPPSWMTYFQVDDIDAGVARAKELGAQVPMPVMDGPGLRFAVVIDPQGATFGLMQPLDMGGDNAN